MAKKGFGDQWVEIAKVGKVKDSTGTERDLTREFLEKVAMNYNAGNHEAAITIGHPELDTAPAFGWTAELRMNGDVLEARFTETNDDFENAVRSGSFKKRSSSFYLDPPNLRHVAFLEAQPPAIKGLKNINFADGESFALEEQTLNLQETEMKDEDIDKLPESFWEKAKAKLGIGAKADLKEGDGGTPAPQPASFTEADAKRITEEAVEAVRAEFNEQLEAKDAKITELEGKVNSGIAGSRRAEAVQFVESIPASKGRHYLKRVGITEFVERALEDDAADQNAAKAISFSEGEGDEKKTIEFSRFDFVKNLIEALPEFIQFGEKFGDIRASAAADAMVNLDRVKTMQAAAGVATKEGGKD